MTTILGLLLSFSLLSSPNVKLDNGSQPALWQTENTAASESAFTVKNYTSVSVGTVIIAEADQSSARIDVTGTGVFSTTLSSDAVNCIIDGQMCPMGVPTWIRVDEHTAVKATWTGNIVVVDTVEIL